MNWEGKSCRFETKFEVRLKNHSLGEHGIGEKFNCDHCEFKVADRDLLEKTYRRRTQNKLGLSWAKLSSSWN